jgi:hypothetical protein
LTQPSPGAHGKRHPGRLLGVFFHQCGTELDRAKKELIERTEKLREKI